MPEIDRLHGGNSCCLQAFQNLTRSTSMASRQKSLEWLEVIAAKKERLVRFNFEMVESRVYWMMYRERFMPLFSRQVS